MVDSVNAHQVNISIIRELNYGHVDENGKSTCHVVKRKQDRVKEAGKI